MPETRDQFMRLTYIHCLALAGLVVRVGVALASDRIYHPDEIFQYMEQAHRLTFGYGYIPWEYRYGTRSWILPGFISSILFFCKGFQIDNPTVYTVIIKVVFCILSTSLIYSIYILAREIAGVEAGKLAATFTCFWYELVYFAHKPLPELLSTYLIAAALACTVLKPTKTSLLLVGFFSASSVILRLQYLPVIVVVTVFMYIKRGKHEIFMAALMFFLVVGIAGCIDYFTWGSFFGSFYNNYLFNAVYGIGKLFGTERFYYFLESLTVASMGLFAITGILSCFRLNKVWLLLGVLGSIILPHSVIPHKEYRFVFATIPIFLTLLAIILLDFISFQKKIITFLPISIFFVLSLAGLFGKLPFQQRVVYRDLRSQLLAKEEILQAYLFLYKEPDLAGILNTSAAWFMTGGYYYLHRDVPIYSTEDLKFKDDLRFYVSHIVCPTHQKDTPGFTTTQKMKTLEIRRQTNPPSHYVILDVDTKNVLQNGIDDTFTTTVKKRW